MNIEEFIRTSSGIRRQRIEEIVAYFRKEYKQVIEKVYYEKPTFMLEDIVVEKGNRSFHPFISFWASKEHFSMFFLTMYKEEIVLGELGIALPKGVSFGANSLKIRDDGEMPMAIIKWLIDKNFNT